MMMFTPTELLPPRWLRNGHAETIYAKALSSTPPDYRRELVVDSYGVDLVAYDFVDAPNVDAPVVVLFHGLEGSSRSHYAIELMKTVQQYGWHGVVAHFRSCGGVASHRVYHSGDSREIAHMLGCLKTRYPHQKLYAVGVSLGGNALAKYLGEQGDDALVDAAAVVSAPVDLNAAAAALDVGLSRLFYTPYFLSSLNQKVQKIEGVFVSKLSQFDDLYTAPLNGFSGSRDYYTRSQSLPYLPRIMRPTLLLNAQNDPFLPAQYLPTAKDVSNHITLLQPQHGGHCGFVSGVGRGHIRWLPETVLSYFESVKPVLPQPEPFRQPESMGLVKSHISL